MQSIPLCDLVLGAANQPARRWVGMGQARSHTLQAEGPPLRHGDSAWEEHSSATSFTPDWRLSDTGPYQYIYVMPRMHVRQNRSLFQYALFTSTFPGAG